MPGVAAGPPLPVLLSCSKLCLAVQLIEGRPGRLRSGDGAESFYWRVGFTNGDGAAWGILVKCVGSRQRTISPIVSSPQLKIRILFVALLHLSVQVDNEYTYPKSSSDSILIHT